MTAKKISRTFNFYSKHFSIVHSSIYVVSTLAIGVIGLMVVLKLLGSFTRFFFWTPFVFLWFAGLFTQVYAWCFLYCYYFEKPGDEDAFFRNLVYEMSDDPLGIQPKA